MNEKEQQLTFEKGITNVPSDALCSDNALELAVNLTFRDGEHHVIQRPKLKVEASLQLVFVHKMQNGQENYIYYNYGDGSLYWYDTFLHNVYQYTSAPTVTAIGNTLIVTGQRSRSEGIYAKEYLLWKGDGYDTLGDRLPEIDVYFDIEGTNSGAFGGSTQSAGYALVQNHSASNGILTGTDNQTAVEDGKDEEYNNLVLGLYAKNKKDIAQRKGFPLPFFARAAIELYDGTYTNHTVPVLLFPVIQWGTYGLRHGNKLYLYTRYCHLRVRLNTDLSRYSDIVKNVSVFVTDGIEIYNTTASQTISAKSATAPVLTDGITAGANDSNEFETQTGSTPNTWYFDVLVSREKSSIENDISSASIFYKLCDLGIKPFPKKRVNGLIQEHTLENLREQQQLSDGYLPLAPLAAEQAYTYNSRLILANITRGYYKGAQQFLPLGGTQETYQCFVHINTPEGERIVKKTVTTKEVIGRFYFFYPDARATSVDIFTDATNYFTRALTEHAGLNGAFYFAGLPDGTGMPETTTGGQPQEETKPETLSSYILQSEVNNPFTFSAQGYNRVGTGNIIGMAAQTQALSQGQFGQYPLIAFTTDGIWAMSLDGTGAFTSVRPMSREVCSSAKSITPVDGAIFFASRKGLMLVNGSQVTCVSQQLTGKLGTAGLPSDDTFTSYLQNAVIAYDYRDSLLWIFNISTGYGEQCWVYAIKSGTFAIAELDMQVNVVVNNYPDFLLQDTDHRIYSLYTRDAPTEEAAQSTARYQASIVTRPMKLENALALKSIMQVRHIGDLSGSMTLRVYASNNLRQWVELKSLRGVPWKYYRFSYSFSGLKATDTFAGTMVVTQERRTNKMR